MELTEANRQAQATWNNNACGWRNDDERAPDYAEMARRRYEEDDSWIPDILDFPSMREKQVLEIGHGMGCDLATAALNGAITHGIDLTPNHHELAKRNFSDLGLTGDFHLGNAGELPFADASMDVVYSLGVLHHTDNTERCIAEIYRVLRPGGRFVMSLYSFWSLPHALYVLKGLQTGQLVRLGYKDYLSTIERGADGINIKPLVKLYSDLQVRQLVSSFSKSTIKRRGFNQMSIPLIGRYIGDGAAQRVSRHWGWYIIADCKK